MATTDDKEKEAPLEIVETDDQFKPLVADKSAAEEGDDKLSIEAGSEDKDEAADEQPDADPEREKLRLERRLRRKIAKEMRREARESEKAELEALRKQNADLVNRVNEIQKTQTGTTEEALKGKIQQAINTYKRAEEDLGLAIEAGDGKRAQQALRVRDESKDVAQQLDAQLRSLKTTATKQMGPDPSEVRLHQEWTRKNTWFDADKGDEDSRMALVINQTLLDEGYRPNTPAFWNELDSRCKKFIKPAGRKAAREEDPVEEDKPAARGGPPVSGGGREGPGVPGKRQVYVSPERKRALVEAGVWDDPVARERYLRKYHEWDRNNASAR